MRVDRRFGFVMAASLLWGLLVAAVFYRVAGSAGGRSGPAEPKKPLVVASQALPLGAMIDAESVRLHQVPESLFPVGGFSKLEDVLDRPVISPIQAEEAVVEARIAARGSGLGLAPLIPSGMRAISVRVNDVVGVAGFVLPGMRVDVLVTGRPPGRADSYTRTVLQDIAVLSAGQTIQTDGKSQAIATPVVTLLVSPQDAEMLTLANNEGHIQLVLRNSTDRQTSGTRGRQTAELFHAGGAEPPQPAAAAPPQPKPQRAAAPRRVPENEPAPVPPPPVVAAAPAAPEQVLLIRGSVKTLELTTRKAGEGK